MDAHENGRQQPENCDVPPGFIGEVVELKSVVSYFAPMGHENATHEHKGSQRD
jgi:hypothetical protein